jgi:hypothetical protein
VSIISSMLIRYEHQYSLLRDTVVDGHMHTKKDWLDCYFTKHSAISHIAACRISPSFSFSPTAHRSLPSGAKTNWRRKSPSCAKRSSSWKGSSLPNNHPLSMLVEGFLGFFVLREGATDGWGGRRVGSGCSGGRESFKSEGVELDDHSQQISMRVSQKTLGKPLFLNPSSLPPAGKAGGLNLSSE